MKKSVIIFVLIITGCYSYVFGHLHFEIRDDIDLPIGGGYSTSTNGYINLTEFIMNNR